MLTFFHIFSTSKQNPTKRNSSMVRSEWKKTHSSEWWVWRMGSSEWWVRRRGASGFVGDLVRVGSRTMARRSRRWCDDLSTLSSFSLCLSLCAWSRNGETISMIGDWVRRGWVWMIGAVRSSYSDVIWLYSCSDKVIFLLSLSLSLFYFPRPEIIWSENENGNHFPPFWLYFTVNPEMLFSLTQFEVTTKHPLFRKIISGISLKPKQTQPKFD